MTIDTCIIVKNEEKTIKIKQKAAAQGNVL